MRSHTVINQSYCSNEDFVLALDRQEHEDLRTLEAKLRKPLSEEQKRRIGVSKLKNFLEDLLLQMYMKRLPATTVALKQQAEEVVRTIQLRLLSHADILATYACHSTMTLAGS